MNQIVSTEHHIMHRLAFLYGNIKPDVSQQARVNHHVELTYDTMYDALIQSIDRTQTIEKRWQALGVVCHYLADYSCRFHVDETDKYKPLLKHLHYEWCLHRYIEEQLRQMSRAPWTLSESTIADIHQCMKKMMDVKHMDTVNKQQAVMTFIQVYKRHMPSYHTDYIFGATSMLTMTQMVVALWEQNLEVVPMSKIHSNMVV